MSAYLYEVIVTALPRPSSRKIWPYDPQSESAGAPHSNFYRVQWYRIKQNQKFCLSEVHPQTVYNVSVLMNLVQKFEAEPSSANIICFLNDRNQLDFVVVMVQI